MLFHQRERQRDLDGAEAEGETFTDARKRGLLGEHDTQLREAILKAGLWVAADRASKGDAHPGGSATIDDAWLIVHIVGALILRLSRSPSRGDLG